MGTGLWGLGYQLRSNRGLVLLSSGTELPNEILNDFGHLFSHKIGGEILKRKNSS
jgi:hypothetical protein